MSELEKYIRDNLRAGYSSTLLKAHLLKCGVSIAEINDAFAAVNTTQGSQPLIEEMNTDAKNSFFYLRVFALTLVSIGIFILFAIFFDTRDVISRALIGTLVVIFGFMCALFLNKSASSGTQFEMGIYLISAITSLLLSAVFVFTNEMTRLYKQTGLETEVGRVFQPMPDPFLTGIVFVVLFSLPSFIYYFKWNKKNHIVFASYAVWLVAYVLVHKVFLPNLF